MTAVVEGFRWALLTGSSPQFSPPGSLAALSVVISLAVLVSAFSSSAIPSGRLRT